MQNIRTISLVGAVAILLLIPLIAMQFTSEVVWTLGDFVFAGVVLGGGALMFEIIARTTTNTMYRVIGAVGILLAIAMIWGSMI